MHSTSELPVWDDDWVLARRPPRNPTDPHRPHAFFVEPERTRHGRVEDVATVLLTNRECPFRCLMCDLWKNTTTTRVPAGAVPGQIEQALAALPAVRHVKLYNAGNFFDAQAIPPGDLPRIAALMAPYRSVIIECHPLLVGPRCLQFAERLQGELQVAMGLETVHPEVLPRLNKRMSLADFERAARFLVGYGIAVRAFILLRPPLVDEAEGLEWAKRSVEWAQDVGVECCVVIPTRAGNGAMEELQRQRLFEPPALASLERAVEYGIARARGRVFADLWNVEQLFRCQACGPARRDRLAAMNLSQAIPPRIECRCEGAVALA
jgi:radical SAM enzyme (TIGR01210 family)